MRKLHVGIAIVLVILMLATGVLAYASDDLFLRGKPSVALATPRALVPGASASILVAVTDFRGEPIVGEPVTVSLVALGSASNAPATTLAESRTDDRGIASLTFIVPAVTREVRLRVHTTNDDFDEIIPVDDARAVHVATDRYAYAPGEVIHGRFTLLSGAPARVLDGDGFVTLVDPRGTPVHSARVFADVNGVGVFSIPLGVAIADGDWVLRVESGSAIAIQTLRVTRERAATYVLEFEGAPPYATPRDTIHVNFTARHPVGARADGDVAITASVYDNGWRLVAAKQAPLENGRVPLNVSLAGLSISESGSLLALGAVYSDGASVTNMTRFIPLSRSALEVSILASPPVEGSNVTLRVIASTPDGVPASGALVNATLGGARIPSRVTDARGVATLTAPFVGTRGVIVTADLGNGTRGVREFSLSEPAALAVVPDAARVRVGDIAKLMILRASEQDASLYYEVHARGVLEASGRILARGREIPLEVPTTLAMSPAARVSVFEVGSGVAASRAGTVIGVADEGALEVALEAWPTRVRPGDIVTLNATVAARGTPVDAVLGFAGAGPATTAARERASARFADRVSTELGLDALTAYLVADVHPGRGGFPAVAYAGSELADRFVVSAGSDAYRVQATVLKNGSILAYWAGATVLASIAASLALARVTRVALGRPRTARAVIIAALIVFPSAAAWVITDLPEPAYVAPRVVNEVAVIVSDDARFDGSVPLATLESATAAVRGSVLGSRDGFKTRAELIAESRRFEQDSFAWVPRVLTDAEGRAQTTFTAPRSFGDWRVSAVALTQDGRLAGAVAALAIASDIGIDAKRPTAFPVNAQARVEMTIVSADARAVNITLTALAPPGLEVEPRVQTSRVNAETLTTASVLVTGHVPGVHLLVMNVSTSRAHDAVTIPIRVVAAPTTSNSILVPIAASAPLEFAFSERAPESVRVHAGPEALVGAASDAIHVGSPASADEALARLAAALSAREVSAKGVLNTSAQDALDSRAIRDAQDVLAFTTRAVDGSLTASRFRGGSGAADMTARALHLVARARAADLPVPAEAVQALAHGLEKLALADGSFAGGDAITARAARALAESGSAPARVVAERALLSIAREPADPLAQALILSAQTILGDDTLLTQRARLAARVDASYPTGSVAATVSALVATGASERDIVASVAELLTRVGGFGFGGALDTADALEALAKAVPVRRATVGIAVNGTEVLNQGIPPGGVITVPLDAGASGAVLALGNAGPGIVLLEVTRERTREDAHLTAVLTHEAGAMILRVRALGATHGPLKVAVRTPVGVDALMPPSTPVLQHADISGDALVLYLEAPDANQEVALRIPYDGVPRVGEWFAVDVVDLATGHRASAFTLPRPEVPS